MKKAKTTKVKAKKVSVKEPEELEVKAPELPPEELETPIIPTPTPEPVAKTVYYQNASVVEVLGEKGDFFHCKMSDGTTKHLDKKLFE